jgi:hypothetical protein
MSWEKINDTRLAHSCINIADLDGIVVRLKSVESPVNVTSDGEIFTTVQPVERLSVVIEAPPGYRPNPWSHQINLDEIKHGRLEIHPRFFLATETAVTKPKLEIQSQSIPISNINRRSPTDGDSRPNAAKLLQGERRVWPYRLYWPARLSNKPRPSVPPTSGSMRFSGCGMRPRTRKFSE